jgi:hypothetical protein
VNRRLCNIDKAATQVWPDQTADKASDLLICLQFFITAASVKQTLRKPGDTCRVLMPGAARPDGRLAENRGLALKRGTLFLLGGPQLKWL